MARYEIHSSIPHAQSVIKIGQLPAGNELDLDFCDDFSTQVVTSFEKLSPLQKQLGSAIEQMLVPGWTSAGYDGSETHFRGFFTHPSRNELVDYQTAPRIANLAYRYSIYSNFHRRYIDRNRSKDIDHVGLKDDETSSILEPHGYTIAHFSARHPDFDTIRIDGLPWNRGRRNHFYQPGVIIVQATIDTNERHEDILKVIKEEVYEEYLKPIDDRLKRLNQHPKKPSFPLLTSKS